MLQAAPLPAHPGGPDQELCRQICPVVQKIVLPQGGVAGGFDGQRRVDAGGVQPQRLVDHVFVAPPEPAVYSAQLLDETVQAAGGDGIGDNGAAGILLQHNGGGQRDEPVAVDLPSGGVHTARPVHIGVEDNAHVRPCFYGGGADGGHGLLVFRIGNMVGEAAVRLQELAAADVRAQGLQHLSGVKAPGAVARIHHNAEPGQRPILLPFPQPPRDHVAQTGGVAVHIGKCLRPSLGGGQAVPILGEEQQRLDIAAVQSPGGGEKFQAVAVERMVAGGDLNRAVAAAVHRGHKHGGSGGETAVHRPDAPGGERTDHRFPDAGAGKTAVPAYGNGQLRSRLAGLIG